MTQVLPITKQLKLSLPEETTLKAISKFKESIIIIMEREEILGKRKSQFKTSESNVHLEELQTAKNNQCTFTHLPH